MGAKLQLQACKAKCTKLQSLQERSLSRYSFVSNNTLAGQWPSTGETMYTKVRPLSLSHTQSSTLLSSSPKRRHCWRMVNPETGLQELLCLPKQGTCWAGTSGRAKQWFCRRELSVPERHQLGPPRWEVPQSMRLAYLSRRRQLLCPPASLAPAGLSLRATRAV